MCEVTLNIEPSNVRLGSTCNCPLELMNVRIPLSVVPFRFRDVPDVPEVPLTPDEPAEPSVPPLPAVPFVPLTPEEPEVSGERS